MLSPTTEKPVRMALMRGTRSKLPGIRKISRVLLAQVSSLKLAESGRVAPQWWRKFWSKVRTAVRKAGRTCYVIEEDEVTTYKPGDRFWVARMLQKELELLQGLQKGIGAKVNQLLRCLLELEGLHPGVSDLVDMLRAVVVSFQNDEIDESKRDEVDGWVGEWMGRTRTWIAMEMNRMDGVVVVEDSMEAAVEEGARIESAYVEMVVGLQKRLGQLAGEEEQKRLARSAAMAQQWDDWAVSQALVQCHSPKRQRTVGTQVNDRDIAEASARSQGESSQVEQYGEVMSAGPETLPVLMQVASTALDSVSNVDLEGNEAEGGQDHVCGRQPVGSESEHGNGCAQVQLPEHLPERNEDGVAEVDQEAG